MKRQGKGSVLDRQQKKPRPLASFWEGQCDTPAHGNNTTDTPGSLTAATKMQTGLGSTTHKLLRNFTLDTPALASAETPRMPAAGNQTSKGMRTRSTNKRPPPLFNGQQSTPSFASAFASDRKTPGTPDDDFVLHCSQSYCRNPSQAVDDSSLPDLSLALTQVPSLTSQEPSTMHLSLPGLADDLPSSGEVRPPSQPGCIREVRPLPPLIIPEAAPEHTPEFGPPSSCCLSDCSSNQSVPRSRNHEVFPIFKPKNERKILAIIRHGESEYNAAAAHGRGFHDPHIFDPHLTTKGREQSEALRGKLRELMRKYGDPLWVVSPLTRCLETFMHACPCPERLGAKPLAPEVVQGNATPPSCPPLNLHVSSLIAEHLASSGDVGRAAVHLSQEFPQLEPHLQVLPDNWWYTQPGQPNCAQRQQLNCRESMEHLHSRVERFRTWLSQRPEKFVVLVGHSTYWHTFFKQRERMKNGQCLTQRW